MNPKYFIEVFAALVGVLSVVLSAVIARLKFRNREARFFALSILFSGLWMLSVYIADISANLPDLVFWTKAASILALLFVLFFVIFAFLFRYPHKSFGQYVGFCLPVAVNILYLVYFPQSQVYAADPFIGFSFDQPIGGVLSGKFSLYL